MKTPVLFYASPTLPRLTHKRLAFRWADWCRLFTVVGLVALPIFIGGMIFDYPYAIAGACLFALTGIPLGRCFPLRQRITLCACFLAGCILTAVLHIVTSQGIVIENRSNQSFSSIQIVVNEGQSMRQFSGAFPALRTASWTWHSHELVFEGSIEVRAERADGIQIRASSSSARGNSYGHHTHIVIEKDGAISVSHE